MHRAKRGETAQARQQAADRTGSGGTCGREGALEQQEIAPTQDRGVPRIHWGNGVPQHHRERGHWCIVSEERYYKANLR